MRTLDLSWVVSVVVHGVAVTALCMFGGPIARPRAGPITFEIRAKRGAGAAASAVPASAAAPLPQPARPPAVRPMTRTAHLNAGRRAPRLAQPSPPADVPAQGLPVPQPAGGSAVPAPPEGGGALGQGPLQSRPGAGAGGVDLNGYLGAVNRAVAARKRYPAMAVQLELEGDIQVLLRLHRDGTLAAPPRIVRSSGHQLLDGEALRMVAEAAPFPPLPAGHPQPIAELRIPVHFHLAD